MLIAKKYSMTALVLAGALGTLILATQEGNAQQPNAAGLYSAAQATAGRTAYQTNCAGCHGADLSGQGNASPLAGGLFIGSWGDKSPSDLISFLQGAMPPTNPGGLSEATYVDVVAFLLQSNGARPGNQALTTATKTVIRTVANGQPLAQRAQAGGGAGGRGGRAEAPVPATPRGLTVPGEVKNYMPITDAMLRNPDPSDWLMIRHDYHANNYSTLNQINTRNVKDLQLQWVWAMNEGTNQPAPLVHNGVMFMNNPGNIVQALDAKTGELIWENRIGDGGHREFAARPGDLRRQGLRHHRRGAHLCA